ncbi:hypothetical protein RHMOL_Rhmol12G0102000 [Rhododendron molle]|uniref:Uncharacterized protein n=1 Tax=Rhododendron molle TaxID=49168 RepID=A0ACC0LGP7_RHOML|nr:hypothetical protein RHMOL_Rhmol12G0102000 [Rhododendron molle]
MAQLSKSIEYWQRRHFLIKEITLIYFYDPIEVEQDQQIEGAVTLSQSKENPRFMNIHLEYASGGRSFVKESVMR